MSVSSFPSPSRASSNAAFSPSAAARAATIAALRTAGCVFAEDEAELLIEAAGSGQELSVLVDRRVAGLPLEHVVGWAEFRGLRIAVDPGVFVPRRRTEFLVEQAVALVHPAAGPPLIVDLCCGSGAIGVAVAAAAGPVAGLHAADLDPAAVRCARRNVEVAGGHAHQGDLFDALPDELRGRVTILLANVPYVPTRDLRLLPPEARLHEAGIALDGGADGLDMLRRVAAEAAEWLAPGGHLLVEAGDHQLPAAVEIVSGGGLGVRAAHSGELDAAVIIGTLPGA